MSDEQTAKISLVIRLLPVAVVAAYFVFLVASYMQSVSASNRIREIFEEKMTAWEAAKVVPGVVEPVAE